MKEKIIINLEKVSLDIPIFSSSDFNLKKKLIKSVTGGVFNNSRSKPIVKALDSVTLKVKRGEKNCTDRT